MSDNMEFEKFIKEARRLHGEGKSQEEVLHFLRGNGCSKTQSVIVLASASNCEMAEAKRAVHFSQVWADTKESDEEFHKRIEHDAKKAKQ